MQTREVLSSGNRGTGDFDSLPMRPNADATELIYEIELSAAQLENTENRFDFSLYGSVDNFVTVTFLGACTGWQGGTYTNKQGQVVPMDPPSIIVEATPSIKEMTVRARVSCYRSVRFALFLKD